MEGSSRLKNTTALAFMGDAVYEVYIREHVMQTGEQNVDRLHQMAVRYVRADSQAKAVRAMMRSEFLTEEEEALAKRARNRKSASKPKNADPVTYKLATAFEAVLGWLFLEDQKTRMEEIIFRAIDIIEEGET